MVSAPMMPVVYWSAPEVPMVITTRALTLFPVCPSSRSSAAQPARMAGRGVAPTSPSSSSASSWSAASEKGLRAHTPPPGHDQGRVFQVEVVLGLTPAAEQADRAGGQFPDLRVDDPAHGLRGVGQLAEDPGAHRGHLGPLGGCHDLGQQLAAEAGGGLHQEALLDLQRHAVGAQAGVQPFGQPREKLAAEEVAPPSRISG